MKFCFRKHPKRANCAIPLFKQLGYFTTIVHEPEDIESLRALIKRKFHRETHDKISTDLALQQALYNLFGYLKRTQSSSIEQFTSIHFYEPEDFFLSIQHPSAT